jgi:hypothetical protein
MKNIFIFSMIIAASLMSCNNELETEGLSRITYFPEFILEGDDTYFIGEGDDFTEPGITVLEQGAEIEYTATYVGRYNGYVGTTIGTDPDQYNLNYLATNKDGFSATASRRIIAVNTGDLVTSIEGAYTSQPVRINGQRFPPSIQMIWEISPNVYGISCAVGGHYADGRGDGDGSLALGGTITVNNLAANDFTFTPAHVTGLGGFDMAITSMTVDPATKTISFVAEAAIANGKWNITFVQL